MAPASRRNPGWLPLLTLVAVFPVAWFVSNAGAEERKFVVLLADLTRDKPGPGTGPNAVIPGGLANVDAVRLAYFDKFFNGQPGRARVDSFAEWWEEVSYGDVTVAGDVF